MASTRTKQLLANYIGACLESWWGRESLPGLDRIEVARITNLKYQVKVWEDDGPPRYFVVQIKEEM